MASTSLPSLVHINEEIRFISSSLVVVALRDTHSVSLSEAEYGDGEEAIVIPVMPFPHPYPII